MQISLDQKTYENYTINRFLVTIDMLNCRGGSPEVSGEPGTLPIPYRDAKPLRRLSYSIFSFLFLTKKSTHYRNWI